MCSSCSAHEATWATPAVARWLGWEGPDHGKGSVDDVVSHADVVKSALKRHGMKIYHRAEAKMHAHRDEGHFSVSTMQAGWGKVKLDFYIVLEDSDPQDGSFKSAASLEYGHWNIHPKTKKRTWVEGKWILHDAAGLPHERTNPSPKKR